MTGRLGVLGLLSAAAALGCQGDVGTIRVSLATAPDSTVMDEVTRARLTLTDPFTVVEDTRDPGGSLALEMEVVADGPSGFLTFEGFDAADELIAFGRSGPLPIAAIDADVRIYVATPMSFAEAPVSLEPARSELASTRLSYGVLYAGGRDADGEPVDDLVIYNIYSHEFQVGDGLPSPRSSMTAIAGDFGYVYLFGGFDSDGNESARLWQFDTNVAPAGAYAVMLAEDELARAGASAAAIGQEAFLVTGDPPAVIDGVSGRMLAIDDVGPMIGTATTVISGLVAYTLIAGTGAGSTGAALFVSGEFIELDAPSQTDRTGHASVALADNDILLVAGETAGGLTTSAVRFQAAARELTVVDDLLTTPRRDAAVATTSEYLVVAGGQDADGNIVADAEVFDATTLEPVVTLPMLAPRRGALANALNNGQILIAGGLDQDGAPVGALELFTPAPTTRAASGSSP